MTRRILCILLLLVAAPARAATPIEAGTNANTWVLDADGGLLGLWRLGTEETAAANLIAGIVKVLSGSATIAVPGTGAGSHVLVNRVQGSYPAPLYAPPLSVVSLAAPLNDAAAPDKPAVTVSPAGGTHDATTVVTVQAYPSPLSTEAVTLSVEVDGVAQTVTGTEHTVVLVANGVHTVVATAKQKDAGGILQTTTVTGTLTLEGAAPRRRDTDGDGVPDFWEEKNGLDPLSADLAVDSDGDGWTDFEELLRGSDPHLADDVPADGDGDGWSDWDEALRGTDPLLAESAPVARRRTEVEYLLAGAAFTDAEETLPHAKTGRVTVRDTGWALLAEATTELSVWPVLRVPASAPMVARAQPGLVVESPWVLRAWVHAAEDATPTAIAAELDASGAAWVTAAEWQAEYEAALAAWLVRDVPVALSPATAFGPALVEAAVAWHAGIEAGAPVVFGEEGLAQPLDAVAAAGAYPGGLDALHDDLASLVDGPLDGLAAEVLGWTATPELLDGTTATRALATLVQQPTDAVGEKARYVARLVARDGLDAVLAFAGAGGSPWEPADDPDADGVASALEVAPLPPASTDPLHADSDLDGVSDSADPCPTEPSNDCMVAALQLGDLDGDGVLDALDNCFGLANPAQVDTNDDGIGDACEAPARIATPVTNVAGPEGLVVVFTSMKSAAATGPVSVQWYVDGALASSAPHLGAVTFAAAGPHVVELWAGTGALALTDTRLVQVVGLTGFVCETLDCDDGDPCTADTCSTAVGCAHVPIAGCTPCAADAGCNDGDPCTADVCDLAVGACLPPVALTGTPCSDGNPCTGSDTCAAGACVGGPSPCDDGDPCTIDGCGPVAGCTHTPDPGADPAVCPQCLGDADCGAGACVGGLCCESDIVADSVVTLDPASPVVTVCLAKGQEVAIVGQAAGTGFTLAVSGPDGKSIQKLNGSGSVFIEVEAVAQTGAHTVQVTWTNGTTPVELSVLATPPDVFVTIPETGVATVLEIPEIGQEGELHFDAVAGQELSITGSTTWFCPAIGLTSPSGVVVVPKNVACGATWYKDRYTVTETGTWRILVDPRTAVGGSATFTVHEVPETPVAPLALDGVGVTGSVAVPGGQTAFALDAIAGERIATRVVYGSPSGCYYGTLRAPSGAVLAATTLACGKWFTEVIIAPETGTYTLTVDPNGFVTGSWVATAWIVPPDAEVPLLADGVQATYTTTTPGQDVIFLLDGAAGQSIAISLSGFYCADLTLLAPSGATVFAKGNTCVNWFSDRVELPEDGEYALLMEIATDSVSAAGKITVWDVPPDPEAPLVLDGPPTEVTLSTPSMNATLPVDLIAGSPVQVKAVMPGPSACAKITLYDPLGASLGTKTYCGTIIVPTVTPAMSGTHTVEVDGSGTITGKVTVTATTVL